MGYINFKKTIHFIKAPTLILYGKNDSFVTEAEAKDITKAIPNAKIIMIKNPSHFLASRAQTEISDIILNFIKNHENSPI